MRISIKSGRPTRRPPGTTSSTKPTSERHSSPGNREHRRLLVVSRLKRGRRRRRAHREHRSVIVASRLKRGPRRPHADREHRGVIVGSRLFKKQCPPRMLAVGYRFAPRRPRRRYSPHPPPKDKCARHGSFAPATRTNLASTKTGGSGHTKRQRPTPRPRSPAAVKQRWAPLPRAGRTAPCVRVPKPGRWTKAPWSRTLRVASLLPCAQVGPDRSNEPAGRSAAQCHATWFVGKSHLSARRQQLAPRAHHGGRAGHPAPRPARGRARPATTRLPAWPPASTFPPDLSQKSHPTHPQATLSPQKSQDNDPVPPHLSQYGQKATKPLDTRPPIRHNTDTRKATHTGDPLSLLASPLHSDCRFPRSFAPRGAGGTLSDRSEPNRPAGPITEPKEPESTTRERRRY